MLPLLSSARVLSALRRLGCYEPRKAGGSHQPISRDTPQGRRTQVLVLGKRQVKRELLKGILDGLGLPKTSSMPRQLAGVKANDGQPSTLSPERQRPLGHGVRPLRPASGSHARPRCLFRRPPRFEAPCDPGPEPKLGRYGEFQGGIAAGGKPHARCCAGRGRGTGAAAAPPAPRARAGRPQSARISVYRRAASRTARALTRSSRESTSVQSSRQPRR